MIAYIFAAGLATRLRPVTKEFPKCLLNVGGTPILELWMSAIIKSGQFDKIVINLHHCADMVERFAGTYQKLTKFPIEFIDERKGLLGTAGTLFWHGDTESDFMSVYADTYMQDFCRRGIRELALFWKTAPSRPMAGIVTFPMPYDTSAGAVIVDEMDTVTGFEEKSDRAIRAWSGVLFGGKDFLKNIRQEDRDLARHVFPRLCGKIRALGHFDACDIGRGLDEYEDLNRKIQSTR